MAKHKHVTALFPNLEESSNYALATAYNHAGIKLKVADFPVGYDPTLIGSTVWSTVQGDYFDAEYRPFALPNAGTLQMAAAMQKYAHWSKSKFATFSQDESWVGADLMIKGIQMAGKDPTSAGVIKALRSIKAYNADGLLPVTLNFSTIFGHQAPQCVWVFRAEKTGFVLTSSKPVCGKTLPGTSTAGAS